MRARRAVDALNINLSSWQSIVARVGQHRRTPTRDANFANFEVGGVKAVSLYADKVQLCQTNYMAGEPTHGVYQSHVSPTPPATWGPTQAIANLFPYGGSRNKLLL